MVPQILPQKILFKKLCPKEVLRSSRCIAILSAFVKFFPFLFLNLSLDYINQTCNLGKVMRQREVVYEKFVMKYI